MGPRLVSRGNLNTIDHITVGFLLQWGRGSSAAETRVGEFLSYQEYLLQWGRGSSAAETHHAPEA